MQITCPQCSKMLQAPFPLPSLAKCPFCEGVFTPSLPAEPSLVLSPPAQSPYYPPGVPTVPPVPASVAADRLSGPAIALLITGILWTGFATLNWVGSFDQNRPLPALPIFQQNPDLKRDVERGMKLAPKIGWIFVVMGLLIITGAIQMLKRRGYAMAVTGSIVAMIPCSPCCVIGLPFGIWSMIVLFKPDVQSLFK